MTKPTGQRRAAAPSAAGAAARDRTPAFLRVLKLEESRGYDDRAVFGGLDAFLTRWQAEEPSNPSIERLVAAGVLPAAYRDLSAQARVGWATRALQALEISHPQIPVPPQPSPARREQRELNQPARKAIKGPASDARGADSLAAPPPKKGEASTTKAVSRQPRTANAAASPAGLSPDAPAAALNSARGRAPTLLGKLGVTTVRDLVYLFPRRHNPVRPVAELRTGEEQATLATLLQVRPVRLGRAMEGTEGVIGDDTGNIRAVWFNQKRLAQWLKPETRYVFSGKVTEFQGAAIFDSPDHEEARPGSSLESALQQGGLFPVYPSTEGLFQPALRRMVREALARCADGIPDALPADLRRRNSLIGLRQALWQAHYPEGQEQYDAARRRLAYEELFLIQLGVLAHRRAAEAVAMGVELKPPAGFLDAFYATLLFKLTPAQERVLREVLGDLERPVRPMSRLLQG
ncbi:MAG: hypothetical protein HY681_10455, partial [Chloroflexi bacterium]|nr:hypothetical protein [Chloroflexota bacterium]